MTVGTGPRGLVCTGNGVAHFDHVPAARNRHDAVARAVRSPRAWLGVLAPYQLACAACGFPCALRCCPPHPMRNVPPRAQRCRSHDSFVVSHDTRDCRTPFAAAAAQAQATASPTDQAIAREQREPQYRAARSARARASMKAVINTALKMRSTQFGFRSLLFAPPLTWVSRGNFKRLSS